MNSRRWSRENWLEHGEARLRDAGPSALMLEALCTSAGRTRGSFYHHFGSTEAFIAALAARWRERATDRIAEVALAGRNPHTGRKTLRRMTSGMDHRLDVAMRELARARPEAAAAVAEADARRETVVAELLTAGYGLSAAKAGAAARLLHAVHLSGQIRAPEDVDGFAAGPYALVMEWIEGEADAPVNRRRGRPGGG